MRQAGFFGRPRHDWQSPTRTPARGFTLLELLVVIVIIGLLSSYVGPKLFAHVSKSERQAALNQIDGLSKALDAFRLDVGRYPSSSEGLAALNTRPAGLEKWRGPYMTREIPADPWGRTYQYASPGSHGEYDLFSLGKDGQAGGEGDAADVTNWSR
jgi:general secretion pathway protein G